MRAKKEGISSMERVKAHSNHSGYLEPLCNQKHITDRNILFTSIPHRFGSISDSPLPPKKGDC